MQIPKLITLQWLKKLGACDKALEDFAKLFPDGTEPSVAALTASPHFDCDWLAEKILSAPLLADYEAKSAPLLADYEAKSAPLLADYEAKSATLWADYQAKSAPLWADYDAKRAPLLADYKAKIAPLLADYEAKSAPLWADYKAKIAPLLADYEAKKAKLLMALLRPITGEYTNEALRNQQRTRCDPVQRRRRIERRHGSAS